jgi:type IV secretory pathway TraG/TraD family ATPase VirD4
LVAEKTSSSADPHWTLSGRAALSGLIQFMVSKIERAKADDYFYSRIKSGAFDAEDAVVLADYYIAMVNDPNSYAAYNLLQTGQLNAMNYLHIGTWDGIPDTWRGKEASLSMILDWLNASQIKIAQDIENRRKQGDQMVMMADPQKDLFLEAVNEARQYAYSHRAVLELTQIANTPDRERGSILSTVMAGLGIFRNAAVRNRTSHSDFHFSDLRGLKDPRDGKIKPVTVYLSINMVNADALNPINGIFIELMSKYLLANPPNAATERGEKLGPCPVLFLLDEMPKMQKLQAVIQGPDLGRSQQISYLFVGQDIAQIREKYGADAAQTVISTTAVKIVLRQNDIETAKRFSEMIGMTVKVKENKDDKGKVTEEKTPEELYTPMDIMKLDKKKQIVVVQGYYNKPIEADNKQAYEDPELAEYMKMGRSSPLPEFLITAHHKSMGYAGAPKIYNPKTKEIKLIAAQ